MLPGTRRKLEHRLNVHGLKISIENHKGSTRTGVDPNGKEWKTYLNHHYGYIRGVKGQDKDYLDCFVNDHPEDSELIFVVNQIKPWTKDKQFDEHKVLIGFKNKKEAKQAYLSNYDSPKYFGSISEYTIPEFKNIIGHGKKVVRTMNEHSFEKANVTLNDAKKVKAQAEKFWIENYVKPLQKLNKDDLGYPGDENFDKAYLTFVDVHGYLKHDHNGKIINVNPYGKNIYATDKQKSENTLRYIQDYFGGKYSHELLPNGKVLKVRIADHSGRMKNDEGEDEALHVVIAPMDRTKHTFGDTPENTLRFDGTEGKKKILFHIIKRIKEIKDKNQHIPEKYFVNIGRL